jgi:hypothetical protein
MSGIVTFYLVIAVGCICYAVGYRMGKRSRKITLEGMGAKEAFAYFLNHEIVRHEGDIAMAAADLKKLKRDGVKIPNLPPDLWIEVKK